MSISSKPTRLQGEAFAPPSAPMRVAMSVGPILAFLAALAAIHSAMGIRAVSFVAAAAVGSFAGAGKLVIFAGALQGAPVNVWALAMLVVYGDVGTALFMMANMYYLYRVPFLGRRLAATREAGHAVLREHRWMRRFTWLGVAVFIALPFQGSGAVLGTVLGRLLGLSRLGVLASTLVGSGAGSCALALLGRYGRSRIIQLTDNPLTTAVFVLACIAAIILLGRWFMGKTPEKDS